jgi:tetratricopeptide (TPR) repeat protein
MAKKQVSKDQTTEVLENVEQSLTKAELFFEENRNPLLIAAGVILGVVLAYYGYRKFYADPLEDEAQKEIFMAQKFFEQDSLNLALNGQGNYLGFLDIAEEYGMTKAGNLANYYAGICYLNLGQFKSAIEYLDEFSSDDQILSVVSKGAIGDAFLELDQAEEALEYYTKAANTNDNEFAVPIYLMKAAQTAELMNDYQAALSFYKRLKKDFPKSQEAREIDKNIAYAETKLANK